MNTPRTDAACSGYPAIADFTVKTRELEKLARQLETELAAAKEKLAEIAAENARLREDAKRYLALRNGNAGDWKIGRRNLAHGNIDWVFGTVADETIDAARKGK